MLNFILRIFTSIHIFLYRATRGRLGSWMNGFNVLLLTSVGRKSGRQRVNPLGYITDQGRYVIIASNSGRNKNPGWYHNLKTNPTTVIQVKDQVIPVTSQEVLEPERTRLWEKLVQSAPAYKVYARSTKRIIPLVALTPQGKNPENA